MEVYLLLRGQAKGTLVSLVLRNALCPKAEICGRFRALNMHGGASDMYNTSDQLYIYRKEKMKS